MATFSKFRGCLVWSVFGTLALLVLVWFVSWSWLPGRNGVQRADVNRLKQLILALKMYASENDDNYPDSAVPGLKSANQVFRELFKAEILHYERSFESRGISNIDNSIGSAPAFAEALTPGECRWMLLKGQTAAAHPKTPIVIESAHSPIWPPQWDVSQSGFLDQWRQGQNNSYGSARKDRAVIIARNDGSVAVEKLRSDGTLDWHSPSNLDEHGKSWIDYLTPEQVAKLEYWDIEQK